MLAMVAVVAVFGGLVAYASMTRQQEEGPAPVLTTIDRDDGDNESTTIAEDAQDQPQQDNDSIFANNTVNTIIINKPVYRNDTIIYQPVTINLENYRTTINQHIEQDDDPADTSHSITIHAKRIKSEGWSGKFTDDKVGMFTAVYDIAGNLVKTGYADERGFTVKGLENKLYFVYPADCDDCNGSKNDILFKQWEDGSKDRPRLVPADSDVTASYRLVVPEKPKQVPLIPPGTKLLSRMNQLDLRFARVFRVGRVALRGQFDIYNLTNSGVVLAQSNDYGSAGATWQRPNNILGARLFKKEVPRWAHVAFVLLWIAISPFFVWREERERAEDAVRSAARDLARASRAELERDSLEGIARMMTVRIAELEGEKARWGEERAALLKKESDKLQQLAGLYARGAEIRSACLGGGDPPAGLAMAWEAQVTGELRRWGGTYAVRFKDPPGAETYSFKGATEAQEKVWNFMNRRLKVLGEILAELRR